MKKSILSIGFLCLCYSTGFSQLTWDFESDATGSLPAGYTKESGTWEVKADNSGGGTKVLAQTGAEAFNLALVTSPAHKDLDISVKVKAISGVGDQGGGMVWRAKDKSNYYVVRYNPISATNRLDIRYMKAGARTTLTGVNVSNAAGWHTIRVTMQGDAIACYFDGEKVLNSVDGTFPDAGKIGLWTKADAVTHFDSLKVTSEATPTGILVKNNSLKSINSSVQLWGRAGSEISGIRIHSGASLFDVQGRKSFPLNLDLLNK